MKFNFRFFRNRKTLNKQELMFLHTLVSDVYGGKQTFEQTTLDDCLHLRMRIKGVLDDLE